MSSHSIPQNTSFLDNTQRTSYARERDRLIAFVVVFLIGITAAVMSDLVLGVSSEIVTYGIVILVIVFLGVFPTISQLFEWKRVLTSATVMQDGQLRSLSAAWAQYAERLSRLEAQRARIRYQSNTVELGRLMNERSKFQPNVVISEEAIDVVINIDRLLGQKASRRVFVIGPEGQEIKSGTRG